MSKCSHQVKKVAKTASERRAVAALRRAEKRKIDKEKFILFVYVARLKNGAYALPFYAKDDGIAAQSLRSFVDSPDGACYIGADLFCIGEFNVMKGVIQPYLINKFISY